MMDKLIEILKREEKLLSELLKTSESLREGLINYGIDAIETLSGKQEEISKSIWHIENERLDCVADIMGISKNEAMGKPLSEIIDSVAGEDRGTLKALRKNLGRLMDRTNEINVFNKVLANRGRRGVSGILQAFSGESNQVCNVKI